MIKTCVTGNIGSGKSTVCRVFAAGGVPVFYCDDEAKEVIYKNVDKIISLFGESVLKDGIFDRKLLANIVFENKDELKKLTDFVYPLVGEELKKFYLKHEKEKMCVVENAVLFESNTQANFDYIITVAVDEETRLKRVKQRDNVEDESVKKRLNNQLPQEYKMANSDFVIWNDGNQLSLNLRVVDVYEKMLKKK